MAKLREIISVLEKIAPPQYALSFDNSGLNIGERDSEIKGVTLCLDATESVIDEAIENGSNLIVSHHPIIFSPIKNLSCDYENYRAVTKAVKNGINVYSMHTNLDAAEGGINDLLASVLGVRNAEILDVVGDNCGIGRVGETEEITLSALAEKVEDLLAFPTRIIGKNKDVSVNKIAVVNGSGADLEYLSRAKQMGAQCFITSEVKHHIALFALSIDLPVIESGHYATERFYIPTLSQKINDALTKAGYNIRITVSDKEQNPYLD